MSLAFDQLCQVTGIMSPSEKVTARFAEAIVAVAHPGERDPLTIAHSAMRVLGSWSGHPHGEFRSPAHV